MSDEKKSAGLTSSCFEVLYSSRRGKGAHIIGVKTLPDFNTGSFSESYLK